MDGLGNESGSVESLSIRSLRHRHKRGERGVNGVQRKSGFERSVESRSTITPGRIGKDDVGAILCDCVRGLIQNTFTINVRKCDVFADYLCTARCGHLESVRSRG